jgi:hypothetical protein
VQLIRGVPEAQRVVEAYAVKYKEWRASQLDGASSSLQELVARKTAADALLVNAQLMLNRSADDNRAAGSPNDHASSVLSAAAGAVTTSTTLASCIGSGWERTPATLGASRTVVEQYIASVNDAHAKLLEARAALEERGFVSKRSEMVSVLSSTAEMSLRLEHILQRFRELQVVHRQLSVSLATSSQQDATLVMREQASGSMDNASNLMASADTMHSMVMSSADLARTVRQLRTLMLQASGAGVTGVELGDISADGNAAYSSDAAAAVTDARAAVLAAATVSDASLALARKFMRSVPAAEAALHDAERAVMQLQQQQQLRAGVDRSESIARAREALALAAARQQHLRERFREVTHVPRVNFFLQSANDAVVKADTVGGLMDASGRADLQVRVVSCRCRHRPSFLSPPP